MVENSYGRGKAILIGSFPTLAYQRLHDSSIKRLFNAFERRAGVWSEVEVSGPGTQEIEVRRLIGDRVELLFVFNHSTTPTDATISLRLAWPAREARDLVTDRLVGLGQRDGNRLCTGGSRPQKFWRCVSSDADS